MPAIADAIRTIENLPPGILTARQLATAGVPAYVLSRLVGRGDLERLDRGQYIVPGTELSAHFQLAQTALRLRRCAICLISALDYHRLTTEVPSQIWVAVPKGAWLPKKIYPPLQLTQMAPHVFEPGIETHYIDGVPVNIYDAARTVVDCFKYRSHVGLDVAMAALKDYRLQPGSSMDELWNYARLFRMTTVIRPYLEAVLSG